MASKGVSAGVLAKAQDLVKREYVRGGMGRPPEGTCAKMKISERVDPHDVIVLAGVEMSFREAIASVAKAIVTGTAWGPPKTPLDES